ncbi:MAG: DUF982 domain-containing protein [Rhizobium sp.]
MRHIKWSNPIEIGFAHGSSQMVTGPSEALNCMANLWPDRRGPFYVAARSVCRAAIDGRKSAEEAREMFISAMREAHLKIH